MDNTRFHTAFFVSARKLRGSDARRALRRVLTELNAEFPALPKQHDAEAILTPCLPCFVRAIPGTDFVVYFLVRESHVMIYGVG